MEEIKNVISFEELRSQALALGWDDVGVTLAKISEDDIMAYKRWLASHHHAKLTYMENQMRTDPQALLPGAKTAIIFITNYKQEKLKFNSDSGLVASYARGRDYHHIHRKRIKKMIRWLEERSGMANMAKGFSDSSPILEKALAVQAGLGWFGKNTLLIHRRFGTFVLISGILTTLEFSETQVALRLPRCGSCTRCLDACPTQAFSSPYQLNASLCLAYHLIESKLPIPEDIRKKNPGYVFGCDICQDVCPHNKLTPLSLACDFTPEMGVGSYLSLDDLKRIEENPALLHGTPLQRRGVAELRHTLDSTDNPTF